MMYKINTLLLLPLKIYLIVLKHIKSLILLKKLVFILGTVQSFWMGPHGGRFLYELGKGFTVLTHWVKSLQSKATATATASSSVLVCCTSEMAVPWKESAAVVDPGLWLILSTAAVLNNLVWRDEEMEDKYLLWGQICHHLLLWLWNLRYAYIVLSRYSPLRVVDCSLIML